MIEEYWYAVVKPVGGNDVILNICVFQTVANELAIRCGGRVIKVKIIECVDGE